MTILFLSTPLNRCCGISRHLLVLTRGLQDRGHRVIMMSQGGDLVPSLVAAGLRHVEVPIAPQHKTLADALAIARRVVAATRTERVSIIHSHHRWPEVLAWLVGRLLGVPTVMTCHSLVTKTRPFSYRSDALIAVSEAVRRMLVQRFDVPPRKIQVVRNVPRPLASPAPAEVRALRVAQGVPPKTILIGGVGRLHREKGFDLLIEAVADLATQGLPIHCLIAGVGPESHRLQATVSRRRLPVTFVGHDVDVALVYAACDIVAVPSRSESAGLVPLEAAGFAKPVVATSVGGLPELMARPDHGVLVSPESPRDLARGLARLVTDAPARRRLGRRWRTYVQEHCSLPLFLDQTEAVYRELARGAAAPSLTQTLLGFRGIDERRG